MSPRRFLIINNNCDVPKMIYVPHEHRDDFQATLTGQGYKISKTHDLNVVFTCFHILDASQAIHITDACVAWRDNPV